MDVMVRRRHRQRLHRGVGRVGSVAARHADDSTAWLCKQLQWVHVLEASGGQATARSEQPDTRGRARARVDRAGVAASRPRGMVAALTR